METLIALGILSAAMVTLVELGVWSAAERTRSVTRQQVMEAAANVLEAARARDWDDITPDWAGSQRLPPELETRLAGARLRVRVDREKGWTGLKRVTVEIRTTSALGVLNPPVTLVGFFSARSGKMPGGTP